MSDSDANGKEQENSILDLAIEYMSHRRYSPWLSDRKRAVRKRDSSIYHCQQRRGVSEEKGPPSEGSDSC